VTEPVSEEKTGRREGDDRLDSWKEIASYLKRDVSTVQRWEKRGGLPVHRHLHDKLGSIYAFKTELDDWWRNGHDRVEPENEAGVEKNDPRPTAGISARGFVQPQVPRLPRWSVVGAAVLATGAIALSFLAGQWTGTRTAERNQRLSLPSFLAVAPHRGLVSHARFAPDGKTFIFSAGWNGDALDVYLSRVDSLESRSLGLPGAGLLAVSSRGELALALGCDFEHGGRGCRGTLARVPLTGGTPRVIADDVRQADWSPDGGELSAIFEDRQRQTFRLEYPIGHVLYSSLPGGAIRHARISPKGDQIAFFDDRDGSLNAIAVSVVDLAGRKTTLVSGCAKSHGLAWSATGDEIWFSGVCGGSGFALHAVTLSGRKRVLWRNAGPFDLDDLSSDGRALLTLIDVRVGAAGVPPGAVAERDLSYFGWSQVAGISADGTALLFSEHGYRGAPGSPDALYLRKTDGSPAVRLGEGLLARALSPNGEWAIAERLPSARTIPPGSVLPGTLILVPTGVGQSRPIVRGPIVWYGQVSWLPDGRHIAFMGAEEGQDGRCYVQDIDGGLPRPISPQGTTPFFSGRLVVTSDGRFIVARGPDKKASLYPIDGGMPEPIRGITPTDDPIQWNADGKALYVRARQRVPARIYRVELATGHRELWKELMPADPAGVIDVGAQVGRVVITPEGKAYAYSYVRWLCELELVNGLK